MKELITRSISGILYVTLIVVALYNQLGVIILLFVFGCITITEFRAVVKLKSYLPYFIFFVLYAVVGYFLFYKPNNFIRGFVLLLLMFTILTHLFLIKSLFTTNLKTYSPTAKHLVLSTFYLASGMVFIVLLANFEFSFSPDYLLGVFLLIWANDSGAYLVGKNFGKRKLFSRISPKKTIEGLMGGVFFSCLTSYFIAFYSHILSELYWLIIAIIVSVLGTLGDLVESKFKREAHVKDSGNIMPGHGGLLDRLDSVIFAAPFVYLVLIIIHYVS